MNAKWEKYTKEQIFQIAAKSSSAASFTRNLGYTGRGGNVAIVVQAIQSRYPDLDISHFTGQLWSKGKTHIEDGRIRAVPDEQVFCKDSQVSQSCLRNHLLKHPSVEYKCNICGNTGEWLGQPLKLQVHHINGDCHDNRLENLVYLCPNCHSQTDNYCTTKGGSK